MQPASPENVESVQFCARALNGLSEESRDLQTFQLDYEAQNANLLDSKASCDCLLVDGCLPACGYYPCNEDSTFLDGCCETTCAGRCLSTAGQAPARKMLETELKL
jgi:hypothetical protein